MYQLIFHEQICHNLSKKIVLFLFFFFVKICTDDDCRTTVETSAYLLLSIMSGDNDLL